MVKCLHAKDKKIKKKLAWKHWAGAKIYKEKTVSCSWLHFIGHYTFSRYPMKCFNTYGQKCLVIICQTDHKTKSSDCLAVVLDLKGQRCFVRILYWLISNTFIYDAALSLIT